MSPCLDVIPSEINVKLLGDAGKDSQLVELLSKELSLVQRGAKSEEQIFEVKWKVVALAKRCIMVAAVHTESAEVMDTVMNTVGEVLGTTGGDFFTPAGEKIMRDYEKKRGKTTNNTNQKSPGKKPQQQQQQKKNRKPVTGDVEAMESLMEFYKEVNPSKTAQDVKRIWAKGRTDPQALYGRYLEAYKEDAVRLLPWMENYPAVKPQAPASTPVKKQPAKKIAQSTPSSSAKGGGMVGSLIGAIASPVVKLFRPEVDENDFPQAILPNDDDEKDHYFDEKEGRWVFPSDPEGEAERNALAEAKKGPPPMPAAVSKTSAPPAASGMKYVDPFNSAGSSSQSAPPPAAAAPLMPPMPVFADEGDEK